MCCAAAIAAQHDLIGRTAALDVAMEGRKRDQQFTRIAGWIVEPTGDERIDVGALQVDFALVVEADPEHLQGRQASGRDVRGQCAHASLLP
jgi:hypothetical protein